MLHTKQKGNLTELQCMTAFYKLGFCVSIPYGDDARYDFIVDIGGVLKKIQCKTCIFKDGAIKISCRSTRVNTTETIYRRYTKEEIDYFCTYYDNVCYLIPVEECGIAKSLRLLPSKGKQVEGINYAKDYILDVQIEKIIKEK